MVFVAQNSPRKTITRPPNSRISARWGTLGLALSAGLAAALLAFLLVRGRGGEGAAAPDTVSVVTAARAIPARIRLTATLLKLSAMPAQRVPEGSFTTSADLIGKITALPVSAGEAVTDKSLAPPGAAAGLAFALPSSQRAVTVALDPADGVDEFAYPGDHVDVLATDEPGSAPAETHTVLQNVTLLAVGSQTSAGPPAATSPPTPGGVSHVTVAVTPAQAQSLVLAAARGKIHLALRPAGDAGIEVIPAIPAQSLTTAKPLAHLPAKPRVRPHRSIVPTAETANLAPIPLSPLPLVTPVLHPSVVTITIIRGSQSQTVSVAP